MSQRQPPFAGAAFDVVVLASSAGGLTALSQVVSGLPASFPAGLLAVQHLAPGQRSHVAEILRRRTELAVMEAAEDDWVRPGVLYIAPPNRHLLLEPGLRLRLVETERVHFVRPSADRLFETAAAACGRRLLGVVLSGSGSDGNNGVRAIRQAGGTVLAQDPVSAEFRGMPEAAIATGCVDQIVPLLLLCAAVRDLVQAAG